MLRFCFLACVTALLLAAPAFAQEGNPPPFRDEFWDDLAGPWTMQGHVMQDSVAYRADAEWVLDHRFLRLRMKDANAPPEYEAHVYIGYDDERGKYVAHWLDVFGGRSSETLGYGRKKDGAVRFVFEYPDGPFYTTFEKKPGKRWRLVMRTENQAGAWTTFAEYEMKPMGRPQSP